MPKCKNCHSSHMIKSGKFRGKLRDKCKDSGLNFIEGDGRTNEKIIDCHKSTVRRVLFHW